MQTHRSHRGNGGDKAVADKMRQTRDAFTEAAHKARAVAGSLSDKLIHDVKEQSDVVQERVTTYVKKKPLMALGGAMLAGALIALLIRR